MWQEPGCQLQGRSSWCCSRDHLSRTVIEQSTQAKGTGSLSSPLRRIESRSLCSAEISVLKASTYTVESQHTIGKDRQYSLHVSYVTPHVFGVRPLIAWPLASTSPYVQLKADWFSCMMQRSAHERVVDVVRFVKIGSSREISATIASSKEQLSD